MTPDEPKPRLDRIHPVVGFVGGILGGYGVARAVYTDAGLVGGNYLCSVYISHNMSTCDNCQDTVKQHNKAICPECRAVLHANCVIDAGSGLAGFGASMCMCPVCDEESKGARWNGQGL